MKESWLLDPVFRQEYIDFCKLAATDDEVFKTFKDNDRIKTIIENSTEDHRKKTLKWLNENYFLFGSDTIEEEVTPTEARYYYTAALIYKLFKGYVLDDIDIIEIGGGYGGQCLIINKVARVESYTIYDLPEVQMLQRRYLKDFGMRPVFPNGMEPANSHGFLISWCAWSELDLKTRIEYVEKVISKADRYIICSNYNLYEDIGILSSFGMTPKIYNDEISQNVLYYDKP